MIHKTGNRLFIIYTLQWTNVETPLNDELNENYSFYLKALIGSDDLSGGTIKGYR